MDEDRSLREHLIELLDGASAHISLEDALKDFPREHVNTRVNGSPHTAWQLLEHIRLAQWDILDFSKNADYQEMTFPDDYWPKDEGSAHSWKESANKVLDDLRSMRDLVADQHTDLYAKIPHGTGQTVLLVAGHNSYHLGQLVLIKRCLT